MISRSKYEVDEQTVVTLFTHAGIPGAEHIKPLGAGEFNSVYAVDAGGRAYAIKIAPLNTSCILTYETDMMRQEIAHYARMEQAGISVPKVYYSDFSYTDIPVGYFIMERLEGKQLDKMELTAAERLEATQKIAEMTAKLHKVRGEKFGYVQNGLHENWFLALVEMVNNLREDAKRLGRKTRRGDKLFSCIQRHQSTLEAVEARLINFDIWSPNIFCKKSEDGSLNLSWIDPERCLFGDHIADFVCLEFTRLSLKKKKVSMEAYNKVSDLPVVVTDAERIRYALMLGYLALIMEVEKYARYSPRHFGWWRNVLISKFLFSKVFRQLKSLSTNE